MVAPAIIGAAIAAVAGLGSGVASSSSAKGLSNKARRALEKVKSPTVDELLYDLHDLVMQGEFTPEEAEIVVQEATELENVMASPEFRAFQTGALGQLQDIANAPGLDSQSEATLRQLEGDVGRIDRGNREAILANRRARGLGGSGEELAATLQSGQSGVNRFAQLGFDAAAASDARKLQALQSVLSGAGQIEARDFGQQSEKARAQDIINAANARNRQDQLNRNVTIQNQAQAANLSERQRIADANVGFRNQEEIRKADARQQVFENDIRKAGGVGQALQNQAAQVQQQGQGLQNTFGGISQALGNYQAQQDQNALFRDLLSANAQQTQAQKDREYSDALSLYGQANRGV